VCLVFWLLALASYSAPTPAFSTSGGGAIRNWGGRLGAWLADGSYFLLGYSVWWCVAAGVRAWLASLARWMRGEERPRRAPAAGCAAARLLDRAGRAAGGQHRPGVVAPVPLRSRAARPRRRRAGLPGRPAARAVAGIHRLRPGVRRADGAGGGGGVPLLLEPRRRAHRRAIDGFIESRREKREIAEDLAWASAPPASARRRCRKSASRSRSTIPTPVLIEPVVVDVPKSERVAKERQKPLFTELPDSKLPQVDLLDGARAAGNGLARNAGDDLAADREEAQGLRRRGARGAGPARPGDHALRDRAGHRREGLADRRPGQGPGALAVAGVDPRGRDHPRQELHGAGTAQRQAAVDPLSEILGSQVYNEAKSQLTMGLGKDIVGNPVVADLAKMPHVLVAGTTGSGKSVGINAMILSLLYKAEARDVRLLMIDPKMLEMSVYEGIPHLLAPVVTDMKQAGQRPDLVRRRDGAPLQADVQAGRAQPGRLQQEDRRGQGEGTVHLQPLQPDARQPEPLERLPFIVVVIDELADLMMVVGKKIEELIARLAQKARAAGIHLILATQRPSVDVITGLIKANIPTRISFQVSSKIDSRTILDQMGAEALLGMGDMLYMASGTGLPVRVHGAFVSDEEVHRVVAYLKEQGGEPNYIEGVLEGGTVDGEDGGPLAGEAAAEKPTRCTTRPWKSC
jgi:S-DNA-T family DNA segregation ATPase FtsK/SpoIIIE